MWRSQGNFWELVLPSTLHVSRIVRCGSRCLFLLGCLAGPALGSLWSLKGRLWSIDVGCFLGSPEVFPGGFPLVCECVHVSHQVPYMQIQFDNLGVRYFKSEKNQAGNLAQLAKCLPVYTKP